MGECMRQWLETATAQLRYRRAAPGVARELESHLNEQYHAYLQQGCAPGEAEERTVASMGDPLLAGGAPEIAHRPRPAWGAFRALGVAGLWASALSVGGRLFPLAHDPQRPALRQPARARPVQRA